ncbi:MAG: hypothetical protein E7316_09760 [Clostridiales bacterium]|nr:hypothetical protein [Clostridiales bacterium]
MKQLIEALQTLRAPIQQGEYDLHRLVMETLAAHGIPCEHEVSLAPRCRIDLMCGGVGIEIKRGKPVRGRLLEQLTRYARCEGVQGLILVVERSVDLPGSLCGKPVRVICLNRLWGIAL